MPAAFLLMGCDFPEQAIAWLPVYHTLEAMRKDYPEIDYVPVQLIRAIAPDNFKNSCACKFISDDLMHRGEFLQN